MDSARVNMKYPIGPTGQRIGWNHLAFSNGKLMSFELLNIQVGLFS